MEWIDNDQRGGVRGIMVEGEETSQSTYMNDPQAWTIVWDLTMGAGVGWEGEGKEIKIGL